MHYKNGTEAHEGDFAIFKDCSGKVGAGILIALSTGCSTCNAQLVYPALGGIERQYVTISDGYLAADAFAAMEPKITVSASPSTVEIPAPS